MTDICYIGNTYRMTGIKFKLGTHFLIEWWDGDDRTERDVMHGTYEQCLAKQYEMDCDQREAELF